MSQDPNEYEEGLWPLYGEKGAPSGGGGGGRESQSEEGPLTGILVLFVIVATGAEVFLYQHSPKVFLWLNVILGAIIASGIVGLTIYGSVKLVRKKGWAYFGKTVLVILAILGTIAGLIFLGFAFSPRVPIVIVSGMVALGFIALLAYIFAKDLNEPSTSIGKEELPDSMAIFGGCVSIAGLVLGIFHHQAFGISSGIWGAIAGFFAGFILSFVLYALIMALGILLMIVLGPLWLILEKRMSTLISQSIIIGMATIVVLSGLSLLAYKFIPQFHNIILRTWNMLPT
jgi:hypothetical protein